MPENTKQIEPLRIEPLQLPTIETTKAFVLDIPLQVDVYPPLQALCVAHFRPTQNWKKDEPEHNFGFDWLRMGDGNQWSDTNPVKDHYANLIGRYYDTAGNVSTDANNWTNDFRHQMDLYKSLLINSFPRAFFIPWKTLQPGICPNSYPNEVKRAIDTSQYYYTVPILFLKSLGSASLSLRLELYPKLSAPKRIVIREHRAGNGAFTVNPAAISPVKDGKHNLTITSLKQIDDFELIDAVAVYDDPANPGAEVEKLCGQLRVHPNNLIRTVNILFVKTRIYKGGARVADGVNIADKEKKFIKKVFEGQLFTNVNSEDYGTLEVRGNYTYTPIGGGAPVTENVDSYINSDKKAVKGMHNILTAAFQQDLAAVAATAPAGSREADVNRYRNYAVVYIVDLDTNGINHNTTSRYTVVYQKRQVETVTHEILHYLGLSHTSYANASEPAYRAQATENIMDYSHVLSDRQTASGKARYSLWYWQIKKVWQGLNQLSGQFYTTGIPSEDSNKISAGGEGYYQFMSKPRI